MRQVVGSIQTRGNEIFKNVISSFWLNMHCLEKFGGKVCVNGNSAYPAMCGLEREADIIKNNNKCQAEKLFLQKKTQHL